MQTPFFGPAYISRSTNLADCRCVNLYPEVVETKQGKNVGALYLMPGQTLLTTVGNGPIRGLHVGQQKLSKFLFIMSGNRLFRLDTNLALVELGTVGTPYMLGPTPMIDNGFQLAAFSGNKASVYNVESNTLAPITLPFNNQPISASYQDGYGIINQAQTALWWQSNLNDFTTWDGLNFASADTYADDVRAIAVVRREVYLIKSLDTEIWYNVGTPGFVFARNQGVLIEHGTCAPGSIAKSGESLLWLEQNSEGLGVVLEVTGYAARRVSTHGLEHHWKTYPTLTDAIAYAFQFDGHSFYVITFPSGDETWVYDRTGSALLGVPIWFQWAAYFNSAFHRHSSNAFALFNGQQIVGDSVNGGLFLLDPNQLLDWQTPRVWLRSWRASAQAVMTPVRFPPLQIDMETGTTVEIAADPRVSLEWSDDGGHKWSNAQFASAGQLGETSLRLIFRRIGSTRRGSGLDRIFRASGEVNYQTKLIGAEFVGP